MGYASRRTFVTAMVKIEINKNSNKVLLKIGRFPVGDVLCTILQHWIDHLSLFKEI